MIKSTFFGMTCNFFKNLKYIFIGDGADIIADNILVPSELRVGDWVAFGGMGSYTYAAKTTFNGMRVSNRIFNFP